MKREYLKEQRTILQSAITDVDVLLSELEVLEIKRKKDELNDKGKSVLDDEIRKKHREIQAVKDKTMDLLDNLEKVYSAKLRDMDSLKADELTEDIKLFNTGIRLTMRDIEDIVERNKDNPTMVQLACRYAKDNGLEGSDNLHYISTSGDIKQLESGNYVAKTCLKWIDNQKQRDNMINKLMGEGSDYQKAMNS